MITRFVAASLILATSCFSAFAQTVVVNEFRNQTPDVVELLVIQNNLDMRGMILKDYSSSGANDGGGGYTFSTDTLWSSLPAGTIIVLRKDNTAADVTVGSGDYNLDVGLGNATYFTTEAGTFDIATSEILQIKASGSGKAGTTGAIHTFASGSASGGAQFTASPAPKLATASGDTGTGESAEASNATQAIGDFNGTGATGDGAAGSIGTWNNANNQAYILSLRGGGGGPTTNVQFTASSASIGEAGVAFTVTVYKTQASGNVSGQISLGGTAELTTDYSVNTTNFTMNGTTTSATFTVSIVDDGTTEIAETVTLTLVNVTGGTLGSPGTFTLTITDNDGPSGSGIMISQYTETDTGSTPKGIEVWNNTGAPITFDSSANKLDVKVGVNGGAPASVATVESGSLAAGAVLVIGTSDMTPDVVEAFTFNGDDSVVLEFGGVVVDMLGVAGTDPGASWDGGGVSTANQNIQLKTGITTSDPDGWTDPSLRFETVGVGSSLTGFGTPPAGGGPTTNVQFTASSASIGEAGVAFTVTVYKTQSSGDVSGQVALGGSALLATDYTINTTNFTLNGATTSATFIVSVTDDVDAESPETVTLTLANVTGGTVGSPSVFTLTINDNDTPPETPEGILSYRFTADPHLAVTTNEPGIVVSAMSLTAGTIETNITTGTYFPNEPYIEESGGWNGADQASAKAFQFTITPDAGFAVTITAITFRAYATAAGPSAFGYNIGGLATFAVDAPDSTLLVVSQAVTGVNNQTAPILVQIQGWTNGSRASSGSGVFRLDDVVIFGVIASSGPTTNVLFTASGATVGEGVGQHTVTVYKTSSDSNVSGQVLLGGSATPATDYSINTTNFTLNGATTSQTFTITVVDDVAVESNETVTLTLANVVGGTAVAPSVYTLTITNNDVAQSPPVLAAIGNRAIRTNQVLVFEVTASPTDGDPVTLTASNLPPTAQFFPTNAAGTFLWANPAPAGVYTVSFHATDDDGTDSETITITVTNTPAGPPAIWINELHYDNAGSDTNQGFEIAGPAGTDLSLVSLVLYDGGTQNAYNSRVLSGTIPNQSNGIGTAWFEITGMTNAATQDPVQNGSNDGVALVYNGSTVIQFLSWEGTVTAVGGPANGQTSTDIGVAESGTTTPLDWSLQLCGNGTSYAEFAWSTNLPHSRGAINPCQTIPGGGNPNDTDGDGMNDSWENDNFGSLTNSATGDFDGDGFLNVEEFVALTLPANSNSFFRATALTNGTTRNIVVPSVTGRVYTLWSTPTLVPTQNWTAIAGPTPGTGGNIALPDGVDTNGRVYRLTVEMATP